MTTPVLTEDGKRLAEALVAHDVLVEHEGEYESQMMVDASDLNAAAASLRLPLEGDASLREAAKAMVHKLIVEFSFCDHQHELKQLREAIARDEDAALARPQPEAKGTVAAGVLIDGLTLEQLIHNYGAAEYNAAVDASEGADPEHYEPKIAEAKAKLMQGIAALASTTPPAEAKTPDAGVGDAEKPSDDLLFAVEARLKAMAADVENLGDRFVWEAGAQAARLCITMPRSQNLTPTGSAGEDDTGVREALAADVLHYIQSSENGLSRVPRQLLCRIEDVLRSGCAPQPPKAETLAGVVETDTLVDRFADALKAKLRASEAKYGWQNGWLKPDWQVDCQRDLARHVAKGDPLDVAAYSAFCWHHGWSTAAIDYQSRVADWVREVSKDDPFDLAEHRDRFVEEALELAQSLGQSADDAHALVDYVFGRPVGEPHQEVGGTMVTLAKLASAAGLDMAAAGDAELSRCWRPEVLEKIRRKRLTRHGRGPLPGVSPATAPAARPGDEVGLDDQFVDLRKASDAASPGDWIVVNGIIAPKDDDSIGAGVAGSVGNPARWPANRAFIIKAVKFARDTLASASAADRGAA